MNTIEIIIYCPTGQDGQLIASELSKLAISSKVVPGIKELCAASVRPECSAIVVAEEALSPSAVQEINHCLQNQEAWSDIPIIVLTTKISNASKTQAVMLETFATSGNVTLLERPLRPLVLTSAIKVAIRSRKRQYEVRQLLEAQK